SAKLRSPAMLLPLESRCFRRWRGRAEPRAVPSALTLSQRPSRPRRVSGLRRSASALAGVLRGPTRCHEPRLRVAAIRCIGSLRHDAGKLQPTCLAIKARAVPFDVLTVAKPGHSMTREETQQLLAGAKGRAAQVPAVEVEQVEDDENDLVPRLRVRQRVLEQHG